MKLQYSNSAAKAEDRSWKVKVRLAEVGPRGFVASSTVKLLRELGVRGQAYRKVIKDLADTAERTSNWIWIRRRDAIWAAKGKN